MTKPFEKPKYGVLVKTEGAPQAIEPDGGKKFKYEQLKAIVGGLVEIVPMPNGKVLVCNEEGKLDGLPVNILATAYWQIEYPINRYPMNNDGCVVGDVLICDSNLID